ncbi:MAG: alkaline phosphatase family protein [Planctomycetes bacterium]|nr:alkaline phosphatase family protein [Planctomycetota bacterium]MCB9900882.1 alkaline phosphatase family protein [Planctomycetota bacterium]
MPTVRPLLWLDVVGLTPRLLQHAPRLSALARQGVSKPLGGVVPAVTTTAQATALTGLTPSGHGIVGNGWFHRGLGEVRFWPQSHRLVQGETVHAAARKRARERGVAYTSATVFAWFNQGAPVDFSVTPKPWYGCDGSKVFGIHGDPVDYPGHLERELGPFPFFSFWGPRAGLPATTWIARATAWTLRTHRPSFTFSYLPHLDYDLQRFGPDAPGTAERVREVDEAAGVVLDAAAETGTEVVVFSEYGLLPVGSVAWPNRVLRKAGLLEVRDGPFGEGLDVFRSRAFAVCDHQIAHVYVREPADVAPVARLLEALPEVGRVLDRDARVSMGLEHPRSGELVVLAKPQSWFAYPFWLDDTKAPDYARTVDIHRKPGYDPCELFVDPKLHMPQLRVARRLLQKKLGMRMKMDVVPLDATLVKGSHGVLSLDGDDGPVFVAGEKADSDRVRTLADLKAHALLRMGLA